MSAKVQIIGAILKLDRPFRIPHIMDMTSIDRNLVRYHIVQLTNAGHLQKIDKSYVVRDREELLNSLLEATESTETSQMKTTTFFDEARTKGANLVAESLIAGKGLEIDQVDLVRHGYVNAIDEIVRELKNLRKYLNNSTKSPRSAAKFFNQMVQGEEVEIYWGAWKKYGGELFTTDLYEFANQIETALKEAE